MPTLTPLALGNEPPRVEVLFDAAEFVAGTDTVTIWQISDAGQIVVRGTNHKSAVGGFFVVDYEVPLGIDVIYRAEQFDVGGGSLGFSAGDTTRIDIPVGSVVFHDPLAPRSWVIVTADAKFARSLVRKRNLAYYRRGFATVGLSSELGLLEDLPLPVWAENSADLAMLEEVFSAGAALVRTMPPMPIPRLLFVMVSQLPEVPFDLRFGGTATLWDIVGSEVTRPELDILQSTLTYSRYVNAYVTYSETLTAYATYLDSKMNPPPEV